MTFWLNLAQWIYPQPWWEVLWGNQKYYFIFTWQDNRKYLQSLFEL